MGAGDAVDAGPGGDPSSTGKYLGVPDGYTAPGRGSSSFNIGGNTGDVDRGYSEVPAGPIAPQYKQGAQFLAGTGKSPAEIAQIQRDLVASGAIPKGTRFQIGVWDAVTAKGMQKVLEYANQQGVDADAALDQMKSAPTSDAGDAPKPLVYDLPDPEAVKAIVQKSGSSILGRKLDQASVDNIAQNFQNEVMNVQKQNYQNQAVDNAKTFEAPDPQVYANQEVVKANPEEATAHSYADQYDQFNQLITQANNIKQY